MVLVAKLRRDDSGQDLIEYALLAALIALACIAAMGFVSGGINTLFGTVRDKLTGAGG
jgi:pilus assembly protein Flp/PilA